MRKKILKIVSSFLVASIALSGCGSKKEESKQGTSENNKASEISVTYWGRFDPTTGNKDQDDNLVWQEFQKREGIDVKFIHPPFGQELDQFKLLIASPKDMPDIVEANWSKYPGGIQKAIKDKVITPLNDYLKDMPNLSKLFEENPELKKQCSTDSGDVYWLPGITNKKIRSYGSLIVRDDWMKKLNLTYPETIDDWDAVLSAFQKNGMEHPIGISYSQLTNPVTFSAAFDVNTTYFVDDDGKIQYAPLTDGYKQYISKMHDWYEKGYLDPDFAAIDQKIIESGVLNDKYGVAFAWFGSALTNYYAATKNPDFKLSCVANPVPHKNDKQKFLCQFRQIVNPTGACITSNCENVSEVLKKFDYFYGEEGKNLVNYGVEGITYTMKDGKPVYTDLITHNPDGLGFGKAAIKYLLTSSNSIGIQNDDNYIEQLYTLEEAKEGKNIANKDADNAEKYVVPPISYTAEEEKEIASLSTDISTYVEENLIAFINGSKSIDEYDNFRKELKNMGADRIVEIQQAALERYSQR